MSAVKDLMESKQRRACEREARIRFWIDLSVIFATGIGIALIFFALAGVLG